MVVLIARVQNLPVLFYHGNLNEDLWHMTVCVYMCISTKVICGNHARTTTVHLVAVYPGQPG